jgi:hypothetical protein
MATVTDLHCAAVQTGYDWSAALQECEQRIGSMKPGSTMAAVVECLANQESLRLPAE